MTRYFIGYWTNDLFQRKHIPIGIVLRSQDNIEARIVDRSILSEAYMPRSELGKAIFNDLENIFKSVEEPCSNPSNLYFKEIKTNINGSLAEQADKLFSEFYNL